MALTQNKNRIRYTRGLFN